MTPLQTRLRYVRSIDANEISEFVNRLPYRIEVKQMVWGGDAWFLWYVPPDDQADVQPNVDLENL